MPSRSRRAPVRAFPWAPSSCQMASISACSRGRPRGSSCCCSMNAEAATPAHVIDLDPRTHRTYHYWHVFVPGIGAGQVYAYRAFGPFDPESGSAFRSEQGSARSLWARRRRPGRVFPAAGEPIRAKRRERDEKRRGRPRRLRLGGRRAAAAELSRPPSFTRCTSPASRVTPARESPPSCGEHMPG